MVREPILPTLLIFFSCCFFFSIASAIDTLTPSHSLSDGETLISANGTFALGFFTPPNNTNRYLGIWFHNLAVHTIVWVANRRNPIPNHNATLSITAADASLHLISKSTPIWSSPSFSNSLANPIAQLLDTGNLVIKTPESTSYLWQSFDYPTDTLLSGMKLGPDLKTGIDRTLTAWITLSDPSPARLALAIDPIGVPQLVVRDVSGSWLWRGGPWDGYSFSGVGSNEFLYEEFLLAFNSTPEEIYFYFNTLGDAISRLTMDQNGSGMIYEWKASSQKWDLNWYPPGDTCDLFPACGTNAVCDIGSSPMCRCLDGFYPRNPVSWGRGNWSDGCVRGTTLSCGANGTDEFMVVRASKLPDTRKAVADMRLGLDECRTRCLMNCSCTAYASADIRRGGNGCIIWMAEITDLRVFSTGGQDLYVRAASPSNWRRKRRQWVFVVTSIAFILLFLVILMCVFFIRRWKRKAKEQSIYSVNWGHEIMHKLKSSKEGNSEISLFEFSQMVSATNNFSDINKLGEGGFGPVYKGKLPEGQDVAIKRLSARSGQDVEQGLKLDWTRRFQIIEGIAQGLLYLHKHSRLRIIHRDLKASNILLDAEMNPKISDFGMARIFDANESQTKTRRIVGTYGYMSPEYAMNGLFSIKSDAFSFGVLLLEIVSGKRNTGFCEFKSWCNLLEYAWDLWKEETWKEFVDPALDNKFRHDEVARCIYVALLCVQESPDDRPIMTEVITMLSNESLCFNNVKQPAFSTTKNDSHSKLPLNLYVNASNDLSVSTIAGR